MNLYLISQEVDNGYDTYDSAVVVAENEEEARNIHPNKCYETIDGFFIYRKTKKPCEWSGWVLEVKDVKVKLIGKAVDNIVKGVVIASFNAG